MVGILVSFWDGLLSGVMLVSGRVSPLERIHITGHECIAKTGYFLPRRSHRPTWFGKEPNEILRISADNEITLGLDMCRVCTEAVLSVAL